jgi:tRNA (guanine-N7-)-methyltransferase
MSESDSDGLPARGIRSFVLRQGRMSDAQKRFLEQEMPRIGLPYAPTALDLDRVFGKKAPCILEIGFGMGNTTAAMAQAHPENHYIGVEVHGPGVGNLCKLIAHHNIPNLRIIQHDAVDVLTHMIPKGSLAGVHVYFPDPWPKKRHHKRRLIQPPLLQKMGECLEEGGYLHCATDWEEYAFWMLQALQAQPGFENTGTDFVPRPAWRPITKFETRGLGLGHGVWDLLFRKRTQAATD